VSRYEVVFSARALVSLRQVTRYIAEESGRDRAAGWLAIAQLEHGPGTSRASQDGYV